MKKFFYATISSLCLIASAFSAPKPPVLEPIEFDVIQEQGEINTYIIDPRVEVVAMICRLAELPGFTNTYKNRADPVIPQMMTLLEKYKNHKAVKTVKSLQKKGFDAGAMISLSYHIKPDFSGTIIEFEPFPENLAPQWKKLGTKATYDFIKQIHSFAVDTNFKRLYVLNKTSYLQDVNYQKKFAEDSGIAQWAEDFFKNDEVESPVLTYSRFIVDAMLRTPASSKPIAYWGFSFMISVRLADICVRACCTPAASLACFIESFVVLIMV